MELTCSDKQVLRRLAEEIKKISELPHQKERINLWRKLNALKPERPMVMMDQLPWNELAGDTDELIIKCSDEYLRGIELEMRKLLYKWNHFKADMVVEPFWRLRMVVDGDPYNTFPGFKIVETTASIDATNDILSHDYRDQFQTWDDIERIGKPKLTLNAPETKNRADILTAVFGDILPIRLTGHTVSFRVWDELAMLRGIAPILYDIADRPEFLHAIMEKATNNMISIRDQLIELGVHDYAQPDIHCSGAFAEDLPSLGSNSLKPSAKDSWTCGAAQVFATVSAGTHYEFDIQYANRFYKDYGHVYYGCCEPLDGKLDIVKQVDNLRKISMSPWTKAKKGAPLIGDEFIYSAKPNPAFLAPDTFDADTVRSEIKYIADVCEENSTPVEFILKDISTVRYDPMRLEQWAKAAMEIVQR